MSRQDFCKDCEQSHNCSEVYRVLGHSDAPSVVWGVIAAFLVPIGVFIGTLAAADRALRGVIGTQRLVTVLSFGVAATVTVLFVFVLRFVRRLFKH